MHRVAQALRSLQIRIVLKMACLGVLGPFDVITRHALPILGIPIQVAQLYISSACVVPSTRALSVVGLVSLQLQGQRQVVDDLVRVFVFVRIIVGIEVAKGRPHQKTVITIKNEIGRILINMVAAEYFLS